MAWASASILRQDHTGRRRGVQAMELSGSRRQVSETLEAEEAASRARFRRNRRLANALLAGMGLLFLATHFVQDAGFWMLLVRSGAEAGLVGGLADWFAITALFRHPLGLPIPHTAIIPRSKERIGDSLGGFIERHFLTPGIVVPKLRQMRAGRRICLWLARPQSAVSITDALVLALPFLIRALGNTEVRDLANRALGRQLREANVAPLIARVMRALFASGEAEMLFDRGVAFAARSLEMHRAQIESMVQGRSQWWVPRAIDRRISGAIIEGLEDVLASLHEPQSDARRAFRAALLDYVHALDASPEMQARVNAVKDRLLDHPDIRAWIGSIWQDLSDVALKDLEASPSKIRTGLERSIRLFGQSLRRDAVMQAHIDASIERVAHYLMSWRGRIGGFFTDVVKSWDAKSLTDRLENTVGSDLQYIRMNGTVVGALVGTMLFLATWWLH